MLINLWYVAEWSHAVKDKPVKARVIGQNLVLFRDTNGTVHAMSDVCIHRGGSLSGGWNTERNCVACPYHGWEFGGDGKVKHIPSLGEGGTISPRARIDAYPVEERYGMIWVFMGDLPEEKRYPIPPLPELGDPKWKVLQAEFEWKAEAARVVENGIDIAHASFVHPAFGHDKTASDNYIESTERHDYWASSVNVMHPPVMKGGFGLRRLIRKENQATRVTPTFWLPGHSIKLKIELNKHMTQLIFDCNTPVDENHTRSFVLHFRDFFKAKMFDKDALRRLYNIFREDATIVENSSPNYLPESLENEMSVKQDKFMSAWRRMRRRCIDEYGWKIDTDTIAESRGKKVFCVPSPKRRENPDIEWLMASVPLVAPSENAIKIVENVMDDEVESA